MTLARHEDVLKVRAMMKELLDLYGEDTAIYLAAELREARESLISAREDSTVLHQQLTTAKTELREARDALLFLLGDDWECPHGVSYKVRCPEKGCGLNVVRKVIKVIP